MCEEEDTLPSRWSKFSMKLKFYAWIKKTLLRLGEGLILSSFIWPKWPLNVWHRTRDILRYYQGYPIHDDVDLNVSNDDVQFSCHCGFVSSARKSTWCNQRHCAKLKHWRKTSRRAQWSIQPSTSIRIANPTRHLDNLRHRLWTIIFPVIMLRVLW
jgi:hypothetical protein